MTEKRGEVCGERLAHAIERLFPVPAPASAPDYRILRSRGNRGHPAPHFTTYAIETEPGTHAIVYLLLTLSAFLPGVLEHFDLPDIYRELASGKHL